MPWIDKPVRFHWDKDRRDHQNGRPALNSKGVADCSEFQGSGCSSPISRKSWGLSPEVPLRQSPGLWGDPPDRDARSAPVSQGNGVPTYIPSGCPDSISARQNDGIFTIKWRFWIASAKNPVDFDQLTPP